MKTELIAEIGQNHNGDLDLAKQLIKLAKESGADVAKFQVYDAKKLFDSSDKNKWYEYNCKTELTKDQLYYLAEYSDNLNIEFMASVFDTKRIEWLEDIGVKRYKIASRSIYDEELIECLINTGKPLIASLGMWKGDNLPNLNSKQDIDYLHCISNYPTKLEELFIKDIDFKTYSGLSDHTIGITAACSSIVLGAKIIEKHFTLDKGMYGPDHEGSMDPNELKFIDNFRKEFELMT